MPKLLAVVVVVVVVVVLYSFSPLAFTAHYFSLFFIRCLMSFLFSLCLNSKLLP